MEDNTCEYSINTEHDEICFNRTEEDEKKYNKIKELSEDQKHEIKEAFELFDTDKDHEIDYHELKVRNEGA